MQEALAPRDDFLARLAATIRDRDLWWNRTPDSETLEFALTQMRTKAFVQAYLAARADDPTVLPAVAAAAERERAEQKAILDRLLREARYFGHGPTRVGVIYGWLPKNTGLHELLTDYSCHLAINVRPNGKASLRSRKDAPVCHRVAQQFRGGGHPNASGADLGLRGIPYYWYILRRGKVKVVERLAEAAVAELARGP
jgi:oligoribonuclease NrnB/cAMP/cGMP phosphodiesterase (DHH superfamily)